MNVKGTSKSNFSFKRFKRHYGQFRSRYLKLFIFISVFIAQRLYSYNQIGAQLSPDSPTYRSTPKAGNLFDFQLILPGSLRPFPVNFIYAVLINDTMRIIFQTLLAVFSWSLLITSLISVLIVKSHERYVWIFVSILAFSPALVYRDTAIMAESIALSVTILLIVSIINLRRCGSSGKKAIFFYSAPLLFLVIQRPTIAIIVLIFLFTSTTLLLIKEGKIYLHRNKKLLLVSALIALIGLTYNAQNSREDWPNNISSSFPVYRDAITPGLQMWENNPFHSEWRAFYIKNGLPECAHDFASYPGPWEYSIGVFGECEKANLWIKNGFWELQLKSILQEPSLVANTFVRFGLESFVPTPGTYRLQQIGLDTLILEFPTFELFGLDRLGGANYLISWNSFLLVLLLCIYLAFRLRQYLPRQKENYEIFLGALFSLTSGLFLSVLIMPSDVFRTALPVNYLFVFLIMFIVLPTLSKNASSKRPK